MEPERKKKHSWRSLRTDHVPPAVVCEIECTQTAVSVRPFVAGDSRSEKRWECKGGIPLGREREKGRRETLQLVYPTTPRTEMVGKLRGVRKDFARKRPNYLGSVDVNLGFFV